MKYKWLNKGVNKGVNNGKLILFFNGWGMDENVVKHLDYEDYDILMFDDYTTLETNFDWNLLDLYSERNLIAWSMGVMIATLFPQIGAKNKTAINGTLRPIDKNYGINPKVYDLTVYSFSDLARMKFIQGMFDLDVKLAVSRDLENQREELIALKNYTANEDFKYTRIIISSKDTIIPTKHQVAYWGIEPNVEAGHCPFMNFAKWSDLL